MDNFDMRDEASMDLFYAEQLTKQLSYNHIDIHIKDENDMSEAEQRDYARLYTCNTSLIDIIYEKIKHAKKLIDQIAI